VKKILLLIIFFVAIFPFKVLGIEENSEEPVLENNVDTPQEQQELEFDMVTLNNCVDGDSARFMLGVEEINVKFLGIQSEKSIKDDLDDEINEAFVKDYVCSALTNATEIKLEYEPNIERKDKFDRIQAWVFVDGVLLQDDLVKNGYAKVLLVEDNYTYKDILVNSQTEARNKKIGIWKENEIPQEENKDEEEKEEKNRNIFQIIIDFFKDIIKKIIEFFDNIISEIL
jgi:micrococcal nuclease